MGSAAKPAELLQQAWVVPDLAVAASRWVEDLGVGPFVLFENVVMEEVRAQGVQSELSMNVGIAYSGNIQIELIEPVRDGVGIYENWLVGADRRPHHIAFWADDFPLQMEHFHNRKYDVALECRMPGGGPRVMYVDAIDTIGCYIELFERTAQSEESFAAIRVAATAWDRSSGAMVTPAN